MLIAISTVAVLLILAGWKFRKRAEVHIPLMASAFAIDFSLLLYIEVSRHAIETLKNDVSTAANEGLLYFHVLVSVIMMILYGVQIGTGFWTAKGHAVSRVFHRNAAYAFLACRLLNYFTSFFVSA